MGTPHVSNKAVVWLALTDKLFDIVRMVGAHLYDGYFRSGSNGQKAQRHSYIVVEVPLRGCHLELFGKNRSDQVLGRRLAVGAGEPYHREPSVPHMGPVPYGKVAQSLVRICDPNKSFVIGEISVRVYHRPCGTALQSLESKGVAVEIITTKGEEHFSALDCAAVGGYPVGTAAIFLI